MAEDPNDNAKSRDAAGSEKETSGAAGPIQKSRVEGIWEKILLVSLGIALSFVTTYFSTNHQAALDRKQQREQFLMNERISALDQFAKTLNGNGEIFEKLDDFQWALIQARESPDSPKAWNQVLRTSRAFLAEQVKWDATLSARGNIMAAIFRRSIPSPPLPPSRQLLPLSSALYRNTKPNRKQRIALADEMFKETQTAHAILVDRMNRDQNMLERMSEHIF